MADSPASFGTGGRYQRPPGWAAPGAALVSSAASEPIPDAGQLGRVHIVGIAGAGMSALARILLAAGVPVSGCEMRDSATVQALRELGAQIWIGHAVEHLDETDTVVHSTAISPTHLELAAARARGLPVLRRAAALAAMITGRRTVAIAGTHGKTSTTSLLTVAAQAAGLDPSYAIGANLHSSGSNGQLGSGPDFIVEADESDGSFLLLRPELALVTNIEADHLENHGDLEGVFRAFEQFVDRIVPGGLLLTCADDPGARRIADYARAAGARVRSYGESADADVLVGGIEEHPDGVRLTVRGLAAEPIAVQVRALVGRHMALNAAAALVLLDELGGDLAAALSSWPEFGGVDRRFEFRGSAAGVRVYDDYAHHPTEVQAQLTAARPVAAAAGGRLIAVFQPGTFSRTQIFAHEFGLALATADLAVVLDIYPAREEPLPGVTGALIAEQIPLPADRVVYEPDRQAVAGRLAELANTGDLILTMGIGDVYLLCPDILAALQHRAAGR
ncbi:MAG TPA: UDP-N-acetylmuramate--L-alanine ligase [Jatrophihabitans sp.]|nr:UDP-N-acetylmuramate--L-alanine ligase [Jatrophihabitans sp.]